MAARRCSLCALNLPLTGVACCPVCGGELDYMITAIVTPGWEEEVRRRLAVESASGMERLVGWRCEQLVAAGYDPVDAGVLAARAVGPDAIDLHRACELLLAGCSPTTALEILL